ncbi:hypothetical protein VDP73_21230 [Xanthomonas campestris pv. campestris]|uniref:hypothetical protein n=1 Tax=Xanthomonas campestris TaxID=339 RepID=UPI002378FBFE|nr:hypothetical protein [Xanthomonas campestris]MDM7802465.1 hypothetical protein [Xanthomonas campestris pv. campestris]MDO0811554.1 hypothetical protein [Xanthomonas campestris pv. campestris]MDO0829781.1 hypothetical protein [Xanthomonas campestris pv. campestris]MEB1307946.1 hypothetical protein [Xanthomonas campestris pv. campestris]MEB1316390.1 hypothetical protein [Xanthomonas campestris pv. campestris]
MPLKPDSFVIARATDLLPGAIFTTGGNWFMHALVFRNYAPAHAAVALTFKGATNFIQGEMGVTLAPRLKAEIRVIGPIQGPGTPPPASIAWTDSDEPVIVAADTLITFAGAESSAINRLDAFYATHWGVWVLDAEGRELSRDPLFVIGAEA